MGSDAVTPPYTPSPPTPLYSSELLPGERTVEFNRHPSSRPVPMGVYRRITDRLTIALRGQYPGSISPTYDRKGVIQGDVILNLNTGGLTSVILKLEGHFLLHASGAPLSTTFLSVNRVLWSASHAHACPGTIAFQVIFPLTFDDGGQARALPPTFESGEPHAACSYSLTVELSRASRSRSLFKESEALKVPLVYRPRSRPHLPMLSSDLSFMSTLKTSPEEWRQVTCTVPMSQGSGLAPVECLLFIPSVQTYALSDAIPFHLQIRGSPASLIPFLERDQGGRSATGTEKWNGGTVIRIYLHRQVIATIHGRSTSSSRNLGEGTLEPSQILPSNHHAFLRHPLGEGMDSLDWDGVLRCSEDAVPSFFTNQISVKDSIVLSITPRKPLKSPLLGVKHACQIRLVTDPWLNDNST